jgi:hypothetical protein
MAAELIISGLSAALQAIQTWYQIRDSREAARVFDTEYRLQLDSPAMKTAARRLENLVPDAILETMKQRVQSCWTRYQEVLTGGFLPGEIDEATQSLKLCVCRELRRIRELNGSLPAGILSEWWDAYCKPS